MVKRDKFYYFFVFSIIILAIVAFALLKGEVSLSPRLKSSESANIYLSNEKFSSEEIFSLLNQRIDIKQIPEVEEGAVFVDSDIYEQVLEKGVAEIIIWFNDPIDSYDIDKIKENVLDKQNLLLNDLNGIENAFKVKYRYNLVNGIAGEINGDGLEIISKHPLVNSVYLEKPLQPMLTESVPLIKADHVWNLKDSNNFNITGTGQTVCVVDTGINYLHPDLGGCFGLGCKVKGGYDFFDMDNDPIDEVGHGTNVAGTVSAKGGLNGVAPDAELVAVRMCNGGTCPGSAAIAGIDYCLSNIDALGIDAITMSMGLGTGGGFGPYGPGASPCPTWMEQGLQAATFLGIPITISSGNGGWGNGLTYPACSPNVISVGATCDATAQYSSFPVCPGPDYVPTFSNTGSNLDLMAPGAVINTTWSFIPGIGGTYIETVGTSHATPQVAGTIALLKQSNPFLTPYQLEALLKQTGVSVIDTKNNFTFPRIDSLEAVNNSNSLGSNLAFNGSSTPGGVVTFFLDSSLNTNQQYIFALSFGINGFNIGNNHIPLDLDILLQNSLSNPSSIGLTSSLGNLDNNGLGTVQLNIPNNPGLSGITIYGAYIVLDANGQISGISHPVTINIV